MKIKYAKKIDYQAVAKLMIEYDHHENKLDKSFSISKFQEVKDTFFKDLISKRAFYILAEIDNKNLGMIIFSVYSSGKVKWGVLQDLIVNEKYGGQSIGSKLVEYAISELRKKGCREVKSFVMLKNKKAINFWKKKGFKSILQQGYKITKKLNY